MTESSNGMNASEASTEPFTLLLPLSIAIFNDSILDVCPAPIPTVVLFFASTMALLFACATTFHANSRIESLKIAIERGNSNVKGSVLASDAFIPFDDSVIECYKNGIDAIIQPGGSIRDDDVIKRCNEYKIPLYFTGKRVFLH